MEHRQFANSGGNDALATACAPELGEPDFDEPESILARVEAQAARAPQAIAAEFEQERLTYGELNARANRLARRLQREGIGPDEIVGISLERSLEMVVALLAVLKAGGAYIWLDPTYPRERLGFMLEDAQPKALVTKSYLVPALPALPGGLKPLCLDAQAEQIESEIADDLRTKHGGDDLVYIIYTSGSTGQPKGVAMGQQALARMIEWQLESWTLPAAARTLQFTSLNFDVSFQEIFSTLSAGGTLVLTSEAQRREPSALLRLIRDRGVERIFLPFVALQQMAKAFESEPILPLPLRDVIAAGEQLQITPQIRALFEKLEGCPLHNQYGPAETHIIVTALTLRGAPASWPLLPPIGKPLAQARIHFLDENGVPVEAGATGEIYIGGPALARGYLRRDDLTTARFLPDPFSEEPGARLYRSGDLGKLLPDGNIQYLGRGDQQVKVRGVRVELGEIEALLAQHPGVLHAVVAAREIAVGDKRLVAYFVPKADGAAASRDDLRQFLQAKLPPQSVPSAYVAIEKIPLTASGKVDRLALPDPGLEREGAEIVPAETYLQREIVAIWQQNLGTGPIGLRDNFFDLGGDSLIAAQIANDVEKQCRKIVPIAWTFCAPTIEQLVARLQDTPHSLEEELIIGLNTAGTRRPFFCICGFFDIARHLGADQPFYKVDLKRLEQISDPEEAFRRMAEECLRDIRGVQPAGPYRLGGHSLGGVVAFEVARRLQAEGETVDLLALLEPDVMKPSRIGAARRSLGLALSYSRRLLSLSPRQQWKALSASWQSRVQKRRAVRRAARDFAASTREEKGLHLEGNYVAEHYPGKITLFLAAEAHVTKHPGLDPRRDWARLAEGGADVHVIPGDHETMLREPNVRLLAQHLRPYLES